MIGTTLAGAVALAAPSHAQHKKLSPGWIERTPTTTATVSQYPVDLHKMTAIRCSDGKELTVMVLLQQRPDRSKKIYVAGHRDNNDDVNKTDFSAKVPISGVPGHTHATIRLKLLGTTIDGRPAAAWLTIKQDVGGDDIDGSTDTYANLGNPIPAIAAVAAKDLKDIEITGSGNRGEADVGGNAVRTTPRTLKSVGACVGVTLQANAFPLWDVRSALGQYVPGQLWTVKVPAFPAPTR
jgi:hypothetical protein